MIIGFPCQIDSGPHSGSHSSDSQHVSSSTKLKKNFSVHYAAGLLLPEPIIIRAKEYKPSDNLFGC